MPVGDGRGAELSVAVGYDGRDDALSVPVGDGRGAELSVAVGYDGRDDALSVPVGDGRDDALRDRNTSWLR